MRLVMFNLDGAERPGLLRGSGVIDITVHDPELPGDTLEILRAWESAAPRLRGLLADPFIEPLRDFTLRCPLRPRRIMATGANYRDHIAEMAVQAPEEPSCFLKLPGTAAGPGDPIDIPPDCDCVDYEGEIAIVLGRALRDASPDTALGAIAGLTLANDVSSRDLPMSHTVLAKGYPGFCPLGPAIVSLDEVDLTDISFTVSVNGEPRQHGDVGMMIHGFAEIVASYSRALPMEAGDVILTGSPSGVGLASSPPRFLKPADVVEVSSPQLGLLSNPVSAARRVPVSDR